MGTHQGYRVYYKDEDGTVSVLQYMRDSDYPDGRWSYGHHTSPEISTGQSIQAGFVSPDRISVVSTLRQRDGDRTMDFSFQVCTAREQEHDWVVSKSDCYPQPAEKIACN